jgi:hypothetical protein
MSELRSFVDQLRSEALADLPSARIEDDYAELHRASELLEAERLRRLAQLDRRGVGKREGHLSTAAWLASRFRMAWGAARALVRMARGLEGCRRRGERSRRARCRCRRYGCWPPPGRRIRRHSPVPSKSWWMRRGFTRWATSKVAAYWRQAAEREAMLDGEEGLRERRGLHASVTSSGW